MSPVQKFPGERRKPVRAKIAERDTYISQSEMARQVGVAVATAHNWIASGRIPSEGGKALRAGFLKLFPHVADAEARRAMRELLEAQSVWKTVQLVLEVLGQGDPAYGFKLIQSNHGKPNPDANPNAVTLRGPGSS